MSREESAIQELWKTANSVFLRDELAAGLYSKKPMSFESAVKAEPKASALPPIGMLKDLKTVSPSLPLDVLENEPKKSS